MLEAKERARAKRLELEEQLSFLGNERENNRELEGKIADLDRSAVRLHQVEHLSSVMRHFPGTLGCGQTIRYMPTD